MRKLTITMAVSATILCLSSIGWSANAATGPGPSQLYTKAGSRMSRLGAVLSTRISPSVRTVALLVPPLLVTGETAEQKGGAKPARNEAPAHRN
jgi:hypothetical protein